jgi:hypothetical protein
MALSEIIRDSWLRCPAVQEKEVVYPGCGGNCDYLGTPSASASDEDYEDYDDDDHGGDVEEEEEEEEDEEINDVPVSVDEIEIAS